MISSPSGALEGVLQRCATSPTMPASVVMRNVRASGSCSAWRDQIQCRKRRIDRGVGDDRQLARSRQPVDPHRAGDLPLGLGDEGVAGSHDPVDRWHGRRPEGQALRSACAPPDFTTVVAPAFRAAYRTADGIVPSACGGVQSTIPPTPATTAGTTVMQTDDG